MAHLFEEVFVQVSSRTEVQFSMFSTAKLKQSTTISTAGLELAAAGLIAASRSVLTVHTPLRPARSKSIILVLLRHLRPCFLVKCMEGSQNSAAISLTGEMISGATLAASEVVDALAGASGQFENSVGFNVPYMPVGKALLTTACRAG